MAQNKLDLHPGSVLHISGFSSRGHPAKNKYLLIIGCPNDSDVLGFLISSQLVYLEQANYKREVVLIPDRATAFLRQKSIIQCFQMENLSRTGLHEGFERGMVTNAGRLSARYLYLVREAVARSHLLPQSDIELALKVLPAGS